MNLKYFEEEEFIHEFEGDPSESEFIACDFSKVDLSNSDLNNSKFLECSFYKCNLSNLDLTNTSFRDVKFVECKLLGNNFSSAHSLFQVKFEECILDFSVFQNNEMPQSSFYHCSLKDVDFSESKMEEAKFCDSNLDKANFTGANLMKADFSGAINYFIDPMYTKIKKAKFSMPEAMSILHALDIEIN